MEFLVSLLERNVIIALALVGAIMATSGSFLMKKKSLINPGLARFLLKSGYVITWSSVALFIAAGFFG
ncbi:MAG: hypothetical protein VX923_00030 [Pseudomonadota bacterium]|nr:hypothetical protein [Pseudomonadota bacterium]